MVALASGGGRQAGVTVWRDAVVEWLAVRAGLFGWARRRRQWSAAAELFGSARRRCRDDAAATMAPQRWRHPVTAAAGPK
ncbi:hypothetical protein [Dactylosporangium sp. CA-139066]|uniref:hypothetical protein n=1 Tax=Dactylosporangium sp. CA-139066 TaxID=3239930 RepID=UPI003D935F17